MNSKKNLKRNLLICLLAGSAVMYTLPLHAATSVIANNTLPSGWQFVHGEGNIASSGLEMNITQNGQNAVIKWNDFSVGGNATVNFDYTGKDNFNTLNYVNSGKVSQIYGTINAQHEGYNGNIFIVNTAGVQIGPSAQINVGSLHVSSNTLDDNALKNFYDNAHEDKFALGGTGNADAVLMSLGNINATNVTFEGDGRIVIDSERIKDEAGNDKLGYQNINITTSADNTDNIIIGYDAYDETNGYKIADPGTAIATVNGSDFITKADGYMWVEDVEQLQAINTNLSGNYALRNSIDATSTEQQGNEFSSIGITSDGNVDNDEEGFTGKFDGLNYSIFDLNIDETGNDNVGLFGYTTYATISNVTLVGGSIRGNNNVGAVVGNANNTTVTNALNSAAVSGNSNVGGIVGSATNTTVEDAINTGAIEGRENTNGGSNVGGLIGSMNSSHLIGNSYNLGDVTSIGSNVGGLVGYATNSVIGNKADTDTEETELVYNRMDVTGAYNVGGIVGNMEGSTVQNAENSGTVEATGYTTEVYKYHTADNSYDVMSRRNDDDIAEVEVAVANVGGIVGTSSSSDNGSKSAIINVENSGDISSSKNSNNEFYDAGNIGGIIGRANNTDITSATNRENEIRGAHNIGGVAGYLGGNSTVSGGINDGGDIMATGARAAANSSYNVAGGPGAGDNNYYGSNVNNNGFALEHVRNGNTGRETFIIGNMGGIVGYMEGKDAKITGSANRGTVHTFDEFEGTVPDYAKAANAGGVVGKIDRVDTLALADLQGKDENNNDKILKAAVSNSYNTGDVMGYSNVGGIAGMMYNGEVAGSYNLGYISTTRQPGKVGGEGYDALNMGGIVGDTTEGTEAEALLYDVYNKGQIGDSTYTYYGRHVAGIVGRLSGDVEKAYNNGAIYNAYAATGGIAGWMYKGSINNAFNTGNITVNNRDSSTSQVGGIVGAVNVGSEEINLTNLYNLGTLRSFKLDSGNNAVGGIVGAIMNYQHNINISNAYTTGNIYVDDYSGNLVKSIYGEVRGAREYDGGPLNYPTVNTENTYYIQPDTDLGVFDNLYDENNKDNDRDNSNKAIAFVNKHLPGEYQYSDASGIHSLTFTVQSGGDVDGGNKNIVATDDNWRIYYGNTPILNAFLPDAEGYFSQDGNMAGIGSIQYGTAYDPLLTIINAANDTNQLKYEWDKLGISNAAGIAVYGAGLTLDNVNTSGGSGYFGGTIYADGALNLNGGKNDIGLGSAADIYGSAVNITTDGKVTIYGDVTATGNDTTAENNPDTVGSGSITITASDVDVYGTLTSASNNTQDATVKIPGIEDSAVTWTPGDIDDPYASMADIADRFAHTTGTSAVDGNITINANGTWNDADNDNIKDEGEVTGGNVNLYFGNKGEGITTTGGDLTITGTGDVYVDSDLDIGGNLTLNGTGADSEVVLDITNIGQVQADNGTVTDALTGLHNFMHHFSDTDGDGNTITLSAENSGDAKLAVDMWDYEDGVFDLNKYDDIVPNGHTLLQELQNLNISASVLGEDDTVTTTDSAQGVTYIWVSDADQLNGIQEYYDSVVASGGTTNILSYNFALKNDINASDLTDYNVIGTAANGDVIGYSGTFDGRGNRIIGLEVDNEINAGIFSKINQTGAVKNLNVYSGTFTGTDTAGAIAGVNNGTIENITAFGNTVTVTGDEGNAGGIVGVNNNDGTVDDVESSGSVIAEGDNVIVGGLVGTNESGATVNNSYSNSAVTSTSGTNTGLGGVVGVNEGTVSLVDSLGVTNGTNSTNVGGVIGINSGTLNSAYNESIVNGNSNVGGIIGKNDGGSNYTKKEDGTVTWSKGTVENVVNATGVTGTGDYVGGLVGTNIGSVENGRNNGTITGNTNVGGLVGNNASENSVLTNLVNDSSASIIGVKYVGGIAGSNAGTITTGNEETDETVNLINRGTITGQKYVGGVAGSNSGTITNANNDVELNVKNKNQTAQYFGGIAGENTGTINNATNSADVNADGATYVGGIVGYNTKDGKLKGMGNSNEGRVEGASYVGGVIGYNEADIGSDSEDIVEIKNSGTVVANDGGAGGIIGVNNGNVTNANLISEGVVTGTDSTTGETGTGGIFGINNGDITNSTLENTNGTITGVDNTGGLIGINNGKIQYSSLKNTADITVTVADDVSVSNIGGLIGKNTGVIEGGRKDVNGTDAGYYKYQIYNNGTITVTGSGSNIGGLIGNNADETSTGGKKGILTAGYNTGVINAENSTNVGGIAGINAGTIGEVFNTVYNTNGTNGAITGGTNVGGLVGTNSGTLSNAYNTTAVSGNANVGNAVGVNDGTNAKAEFVYDVTNTGNKLIGENINSASVKNSYTSAKDEATADGTNGITYISADKSKNKDSYKNFADGTWKFYDGNSNPLLKVFLTNLTVNDSVEIDGKQVTLNEYLKFVYDADEQDLDIADLIEKGFITAPNKELLEAYKNTLKDQSNGLGESYLLDNTDGQVDAGTYDNWLYSDQIASGSTDGSFNPNNLGYDITFENKNNITIDKATINIDLNDIYHTYGDINNVYSDNDRNNHASYEDSYTINNWNELDKALQDYIKEHLQVSFNDDDDAINGNKTQSVGDYDWSLDFTLDGDKASNYQIGNGGQISNVKVTGTDKSHVEKAKIAIGANNEEIHLGETPDYTGTDINGVLVNGDSLNGDYNYGIAAGSTVENEVGRHENVIGVWIDGTFYDLSGNVDWTKVDGFFANYDITVKPGTLTVTEQLLPDIPQDWPHNRWDYLFTDAPFDRNKDFRERKAEVNFVDGGMEI